MRRSPAMPQSRPDLQQAKPPVPQNAGSWRGREATRPSKVRLLILHADAGAVVGVAGGPCRRDRRWLIGHAVFYDMQPVQGSPEWPPNDSNDSGRILVVRSTTLSGRQGRVTLAAAGGAGRRHAKTAAAPLGVLIPIALLTPSAAITIWRLLVPAAVVTRRLRARQHPAMPSTDTRPLQQSRSAPRARPHRWGRPVRRHTDLGSGAEVATG
jgi:hypothetical protein